MLRFYASTIWKVMTLKWKSLNSDSDMHCYQYISMKDFWNPYLNVAFSRQKFNNWSNQTCTNNHLMSAPIDSVKKIKNYVIIPVPPFQITKTLLRESEWVELNGYTNNTCVSRALRLCKFVELIGKERVCFLIT